MKDISHYKMIELKTSNRHSENKEIIFRTINNKRFARPLIDQS